MGAKKLIVHNNSQLVMAQVRGEYEAREERMKKYDTRIIMDIPTEMELVWKPKLITRVIGGWLDICIWDIDMRI
jgi:hypothetical protein